MLNQKDGDLAAARRAHVEELLRRYPDISADEKDVLVRWYRKEASAMDVAMASQVEAIRPGYRKFRSDMDRLGLRDIVLTALFFGAVGAFIAMIYLFAA